MDQLIRAMDGIKENLKQFLFAQPVLHKVLDYFHLDHWYKSIPKQVHFIWLGSRLYDRHKANIFSWIKCNPDYKIHLWIDSATIWLETVEADLQHMQEFCRDNNIVLHDIAKMPDFDFCVTRSLYNDWVNGEDKVYAIASDYLRLLILSKFGGIYSDMDVICKVKIGQLYNKYGFFGMGIRAHSLERIRDIWFLAAAPNSPIIQQCIEVVEQNYMDYMINGRSVNAGLENRSTNIMDTAYNLFRFNRPTTEPYKVQYVGGYLIINQLNIISKQMCGAEHSQVMYFIDDKFEHLRENSWRAPRRLPGIRGVTIKGIDVEIVINSPSDISVSEEDLLFEINRQITKNGGVTNPRLQELVARNRLNSARLNGI